MLSVAKLAPGQEAYYERSVAQGLDDYYAGRGESPGVWAGRGSRGLDLVGVVADGDLGRLISGSIPPVASGFANTPRHERSPSSGSTERPASGAPTSGSFDPSPGSTSSSELPRASACCTPSATTTIASQSARLTSRPGRQRSPTSKTRPASPAAARPGSSASTRVASSPPPTRTAPAARTTRTCTPTSSSRTWPKAPTARGARSKSDAILRGYRLAAGYLYQSHLRAELSRSLGLEWRNPVKGMPEIRGIPQTVLDAFSTRRRQITDRLEETGGTSWRAAQVAAIETRDRKEAIDLPLVREQW